MATTWHVNECQTPHSCKKWSGHFNLDVTQTQQIDKNNKRQKEKIKISFISNKQHIINHTWND